MTSGVLTTPPTLAANDIPDWLPLRYLDLLPECFPSKWYDQVHSITTQYACHTILTGDNETSFEKNARLEVDVLEGDHISLHLPWLFELYNGVLLDFVRQCFGDQIYVSNDERTAININKISGIGARYEWHVDTNCITGLLFVDDLPAEQGGALVFKKGHDEFYVQPKRGRFYCFITKQLPHAVEPLRNNEVSRFSIPMNYYFDKDNNGRDPCVHQYLMQSK